ncbi:MAG: response regulator, partial [Deltaproteobacteria bacterium]|nr:response regulator [Deltaproteobacteria bacterium]
MDFSGKTILTIDDEPALRRSLQAHFEDSGFQVLGAANGSQGIELFRTRKPEVILCDLRIPGMSGLEVIRIIAAEAPETPLIVLSGAGLLNDALEALRQGAWDYIIKPVSDMASVEHVVNKSLEKARLLEENRLFQERLQVLLKERTRDFNRSQNLIESIFQGMPGLVFVYEQNEEGNFVLVKYNHQQCERILGYHENELLGLSILALLEEEQQALAQARVRMLENRDELLSHEYLIRSKSGEMIPFLVSSYLATFEGKDLIVGFGIDIREKKKTEKSLI